MNGDLRIDEVTFLVCFAQPKHEGMERAPADTYHKHVTTQMPEKTKPVAHHVTTCSMVQCATHSSKTCNLRDIPTLHTQ